MKVKQSMVFRRTKIKKLVSTHLYAGLWHLNVWTEHVYIQIKLRETIVYNNIQKCLELIIWFLYYRYAM